MLYDGECPLCMKEVNFLKKRDAGTGNIDFVDIASEDFAPEHNAGLDYVSAMGEIHAILPDGRVVTKVCVSVTAGTVRIAECVCYISHCENC